MELSALEKKPYHITIACLTSQPWKTTTSCFRTNSDYPMGPSPLAPDIGELPLY
jgi:hypothetical protein